MPAISKIRLTNVVYEDGDKRFNDEVFLLNGHNGAILLENGGGKTVFIHTVLQAILPHTNLGDRKIKETLQLENAPAHIGIEWIINERPRRYMTTAVSLFLYNNKLDSYRYVYEYEEGNSDALEHMPFVKETSNHKRPAYKEEMADYFSAMKSKTHNARTFDTISGFHAFIEENYQIITNEWESIVKINRDEGGIEKFFENCKTTTDLYDRLLIPTVEDSIAGHEQGMFADMFEKQREGFQTYRNLQKSMEEHEAIQRELEKYVTEFEKFSEQQTAYEQAKQRAKGLAETILQQQTAVEKERAENNVAWENWRANDEQFQIQTASYHLLQEEEKTEMLERQHLEKLAIYEEAAEHLQKNEQLFHSLQYAKAKQQLETYKQKYAAYKKELEKHDAEGEVHDYEAELESENAKIHGYFLTQIEQLEKAIQASDIEKRPLIEAMDEIKEKMTRRETELKEENRLFNRTEGQIETKQEQIHDLKQKILANPAQENVQTEFEKWTARQQQLDEDIIRLSQLKRSSEQKVTDLGADREEQLGSLHEIKIQVSEKERDEEQMQAAHDMLINRLAEIRPSWKAIEDLHLKEGSVYGPLVDLAAKLARERETLMDQERLARRFVDDYDEQETFFSDAFLSRRLADWQNQLYVVTGPEFFANLSADDQLVYEAYPLWPLTLVTTEADLEKLNSKVTEIKDRLQYPISILTLEQVKQIGETAPTEMWIAPAHWDTNVKAENFAAWKADLREVAEKTTALRVEKEAEVAKINALLNAFEQFFHTYPKEYKDELREELRALQTEKENIGRAITKLETNIEQTKREIATAEEQIAAFQDEYKGLERHIERATEFFKTEREIADLTLKQTESEQKIARFEKELRELDRAFIRYKEETDLIDEHIAENRQEMNIVKADTLYKEVKSFQAVYTDDAIEVMTERREAFIFRIRGIQQMYGEIRAKYEQAGKDVIRVEGEIGELLESHEEIDTEITFPVDGERLLERAREDVKTGKVEVEKLAKEAGQAKEKFILQKGRVQTEKERFENDFDNAPMYEFDIELERVAGLLQETKQKLTERKTYIEAETKRIEEEQKNIEAAAQHLEKYEVAHHFNSTIVTAITLTEKERSDFSYERMKFVKTITSDLSEKQAELDAGNENIERAKRYFRAFCRETITERKLREMATEGIEIKTTYEDVLEFQQNMLTTVERADQYARNYISEKDKEVQAFINSIHNHLVNVTEQLRIIPKKTKVKICEQWKEIFKFSIPEWTEEDGKNRIRGHMDWILEQLEASHFKNEQGLEDSGKVRKQVETWLQTKSLLQVVMDNQGMKVSCRKVTNDNQVTSRLTTWEQSNQWSGGEKWSKNMTLFLGILNFVAEKKQHIETKMKRHRAVILDNPFGKASSDHVLSPVFFIAEQLGFQIIALTAHADGKFLQDYFPIIYSLKLRASSDETKQVMTKEKSLHHAYFEDHEPEEMERLEEREQLELF